MTARRRKGKAAGRSGAGAAELAPADLRWTCPPLKPSGKAPGITSLLEQERAMAALRTGLSVKAQGFHIFVSGLIGSGRSAVVEMLLRDIRPLCDRVADRVFIHNFREHNRPQLITLPAGRAAAFRDELEDLGHALYTGLLGALRSRPHRMSRRVVLRAAESRDRRIMDALQRQAQKQGCAVVRFQSQTGATTVDVYPVIEGEPVTLDALAAFVLEGKLAESERARMLRSRDQMLDRLDEVNDRIRSEHVRVASELREMDRKVAWIVLRSHHREFVRRWPQPEVANWLDAAGEFIERHLHHFIARDEDDDDGEVVERPGKDGRSTFPGFVAAIAKTSFNDACPVVVENNPTYANLFGTIAAPAEGTAPGPQNVHGGAVLRADGGYLVLRCLDVLSEPGVWAQFKRTLQSRLLEIREFDPTAGAQSGGLQPQAIPIDLKVVLIGEPGVYEHLALEDAQFPQIFKIHAEFETTIPVVKKNLTRYADYLRWVVDREGLRPLVGDAMAAVAEYGARAAGRRDRLITRYSELGDVAREASHIAGNEGAAEVQRAHVERAVELRRRRHDLAQELTERDYAAGYMRMSTSGDTPGQINALTVLDTGTLEFGRPCRITCNSGVAVPQRSGLINIEGLVNLSGPIHDKGVMILEGFLLQEFGRQGALCLQATICFEQLYNGVDGDSASLAQLLALLSSVSSVPLHQYLAITGSVNQKGEVQAVGAVNEKIEGFFRLCRTRRLTGRQGVVLPRANCGDLMLDRDVVAAVAAGKFHVFPVSTVREAIELYTNRSGDEVLELVGSTLERFRELALA